MKFFDNNKWFMLVLIILVLSVGFCYAQKQTKPAGRGPVWDAADSATVVALAKLGIMIPRSFTSSQIDSVCYYLNSKIQVKDLKKAPNFFKDWTNNHPEVVFSPSAVQVIKSSREIRKERQLLISPFEAKIESLNQKIADLVKKAVREDSLRYIEKIKAEKAAEDARKTEESKAKDWIETAARLTGVRGDELRKIQMQGYVMFLNSETTVDNWLAGNREKLVGITFFRHMINMGFKIFPPGEKMDTLGVTCLNRYYGGQLPDFSQLLFDRGKVAQDDSITFDSLMAIIDTLQGINDSLANALMGAQSENRLIRAADTLSKYVPKETTRTTTGKTKSIPIPLDIPKPGEKGLAPKNTDSTLIIIVISVFLVISALVYLLVIEKGMTKKTKNILDAKDTNPDQIVQELRKELKMGPLHDIFYTSGKLAKLVRDNPHQPEKVLTELLEMFPTEPGR